MRQRLKQFWADYSAYIYCATLVLAILVLAIMGSRDNIKVGLTESEKHAAVALKYKAEAQKYMDSVEGQQRVIDSLGREFNKTLHELEGTKELLKHIDRQTKKNVQVSLTDSDSMAYAKLHARAK